MKPIAVPILLLIALIGYSAYMYRPPPPAVPQAQPAKAAEPAVKVLTLAPLGRSEKIPVPHMMKVVMGGKDFRIFCVYADGHEEVFTPGVEKPCKDGDMPYVYAVNLRNDTNTVTWQYSK